MSCFVLDYNEDKFKYFSWFTIGFIYYVSNIIAVVITMYDTISIVANSAQIFALLIYLLVVYNDTDIEITQPIQYYIGALFINLLINIVLFILNSISLYILLVNFMVLIIFGLMFIIIGDKKRLKTDVETGDENQVIYL